MGGETKESAGRTMITLYADGGCRRARPFCPNGLAAFGVVIYQQGRVVARLKQVLVRPATNNQAEYCGLIAGLRWVQAHGTGPVLVRMDSQLVIHQMQGRYQVHHPNMIPLYREAEQLAVAIGHVTFEYVPRSFNDEADKLCNEAMNEAENAPRLDGFRNSPRVRGV
jgi:probable phosphoglycerate mutase